MCALIVSHLQPFLELEMDKRQPQNWNRRGHYQPQVPHIHAVWNAEDHWHLIKKSSDSYGNTSYLSKG